jgi:hypothetical protein
MQLGHGYIVIMHGADVQKYYEHAVKHAGKLRFALTCRCIDPASLKAATKPAYEVGPDTEGYDGWRLGGGLVKAVLGWMVKIQEQDGAANGYYGNSVIV